MAMIYQQLVPVVAVAAGVAKAISTYEDALIKSGFFNASNIDVIDYRSDAGYTAIRMDNVDWNTGWSYTQLAPGGAEFPVETQVSVQWKEIHSVKDRSGDKGLVLDANKVDGNYKGYSSDICGPKYVSHKAAQSVSAIYDGHLSGIIGGIFADHTIRSNDATSPNYNGATVTFANDVPNATYTLKTDLTATPTYLGELGEKLYYELRSAAEVLTKDRSGRIVYFIVNNTTLEAFKKALDAFDRMGRSTESHGDAQRDNVKYTAYQSWINMNDLRIVGLKDSYFPTSGTGDTLAWRCLCSTTDGIKLGVVRNAFNSSIGANGMNLSGGAQYAQQNGLDFNAMMEAIANANPGMLDVMADETGRLSYNSYADKGLLSNSALLNCITMMLERLPLVPGGTWSGHYLLKGQMWSTVVRNNPNQLFEFSVPQKIIARSVTPFVAPTRTSKAAMAAAEAA